MRLRLRPWLIAATIWGILSLIILIEYLEAGESRYLNPLWFLLSILWAEFGFAALFNCLMKRNLNQIWPLILITALPPFMLFVIIRLMVGDL